MSPWLAAIKPEKRGKKENRALVLNFGQARKERNEALESGAYGFKLEFVVE